MDTTPILKLLDHATAEILNRTTIQYQLSLGALAGLGVIIAQIRTLEDPGSPLLYAGAAVLYSLVGLLQLEHDRKIALLAAYRKRLERMLLQEHPEVEVGWEDYRSRSGPNQLAVIAESARYLMTFGATSIFAIVYFATAVQGQHEDGYRIYSYSFAVILAILGAAAIVIISLVLKVARQGNDPVSGPISGP